MSVRLIVRLTNAGSDSAIACRCGACGWRGRRIYPPGVAFDPKPCPKCGSKDIMAAEVER